MVIDVTDATFEAEVLDRSAVTPVVVDLWATWCGPCRTLGPILEKVIGESEGRVVLAKVDTDANPQTAAAFSVQSIPAVYAVVDRKVVNGFIGARGEREVREFVDSLAPSPEQQEVMRSPSDVLSRSSRVTRLSWWPSPHCSPMAGLSTRHSDCSSVCR
jgi:putative thioredoxin